MDESVLNDDRFDDGQIMVLKRAIKSGINMSIYADPEIPWLAMEMIRLRLTSYVT